MSKLDNEEDDYIRALREKRRKSVSGDVFEKMEFRRPLGDSQIIEKFSTPEGEEIYTVKRKVTVDRYTLRQKHEVTYITGKCSCEFPITGEMWVSDLIQPCTICGRRTCPKCRANTDREYIKPSVRGQSVCKKCWNTMAEKMIITCPGCLQPLKECDEIKICVLCGKSICNSCGIRLDTKSNALSCDHCYRRNYYRSEAEVKADEIMNNIVSNWI